MSESNVLARRVLLPASPARGFTLVELLVVIGIIALLISILLPSLNKARQQATSLSCLSNLRQMGFAVQQYAIANKGSLPQGQVYRNAPDDAANTDWTRLIIPYMKPGQGTDYLTGGSTLTGVYHDRDTYESANGPSWLDQSTSLSYAAHRGLMPDIYTAADAVNVKKKPFKISKVPRSTEMILIFDAIQIGNDTGGNYWRAQPVCANLGFNAWYSTTLAQQSNPSTWWGPKPPAGANKDAPDATLANSAPYSNSWIRWRHNNNKLANFLFVDGHAAGMAYRSDGENGTKFGGSELTWRNIMCER